MWWFMITCPFAPASSLVPPASLEKCSARTQGHSNRPDPAQLAPENKTVDIISRY